MSPKKLDTDRKYKLYEKAVQNPENEVSFIHEKFLELRGKPALLLREDFCGTGAISCAWVKQSKKHHSWGVDLDPEPIIYGKENHLSQLSKEEQKRVCYLEENVLNGSAPLVDAAFAFNFSYMIFKKRHLLLNYFKKVRSSLKKDGVFFLDVFGGPDSQTLLEEETEHENFSYYWDCQKYNPITNECFFGIHFKYKGKKYKDVFTYDWRLWTIPELRELLYSM